MVDRPSSELDEVPEERNPTEDAPVEPEGASVKILLDRNLRKIFPYVWKRRWLLVLTFGLMAIYSGGLQLRNLVPGLFFDGVLMPAFGGGKSVMPESFKKALAVIGVESGDSERPIRLEGSFEDLEFESYKKIDDRKAAEGEQRYEDGAIRRVTVRGVRIGKIAIDRSEGDLIPFSELVVNCEPDALRVVENDEGPALVMIERGHLKLREVREKPSRDLLTTLLIAGLVVCMLIFASRFAFKLLEQFVLQNVLADLRQDLIGHMSTLSLAFFHTRSRGDLLSRLSSDLNKVNATLQIIFGDLLLQPIILVFSAAMCLYICWWLALIVLASFPILFLLMTKAGRRVRKRSHKQSTKRGLMTTAAEQLFSGIRTVKSFNMEGIEREHFGEKNRSVVREALRTARAKIFTNTVVELVSHVGIIAVLGIGGYFLVEDELGLSTGQLVTFLATVNTMYHPVKVLAKAYTSFQESMGAMDRVMEIFDDRPTVADDDEAETLPPFRDSVRFENVSFSYGREPVLHNVSLDIRAGTLTAIVGPTGAGKSTVVDLILRFYDPTEGRILLDGRDIRKATHDSLTAQISIVSQEPFLFDTTIANNIRYGRTTATRAEIEEAARMANIHDFIATLPDGYETKIGDRGVMLSGGQRQRLTIARALLKDAPILILDEATSNLDSESESAVQDALEKLIKVRSTIAIAHRLSTIVKANQIIALADGCVVETGRFEELLERKGLFYRLYSKQIATNGGAEHGGDGESVAESVSGLDGEA